MEDKLTKKLQIRFIRIGIVDFTIDQQPYLQGFMPVVQLILNIRYGIKPAVIDAGANVINKDSVEDVLRLSLEGYR
jgi:simple sugar transport system substrate-binding protein